MKFSMEIFDNSCWFRNSTSRLSY